MPEVLQFFDLSVTEWLLALFSGVLVGIAKTGISGAGMLSIPILAEIFGGKLSAGLLLPMLCAGDIVGVSYYHRHADWSYLRKLLPWSMLGILAGVWVGEIISDQVFKYIMAVTVLGGITVMLWREHCCSESDIPDYQWFAVLMGLVGGFTSMIGNAAGPVIALYFLSMRIPKYTYIGTWAWFFLIVNFAKVPFHAFIWKTITLQTLAFDISMIPAIAIGAVVGVTVVKRIPEKVYRTVIILMTVAAAFKLFF